MKKINIKQRSLEWHNLRQKRLGASQAWAIVQHYATDGELLAAGIDPKTARDEINKPYQSAYAIYQQITGNPYPENIDPWDSQFGEALEFWVRSQYVTAPRADVYYDEFNICSCDMVDAVDGPWNAPIVEIKSRRQIADELPLSWQLQVSLQCRAAGERFAGILQVAMKSYDERLRAAIAFAYQKMNKKQFLKCVDAVDKEFDFRTYNRNDRLLALYDVCAGRFWSDVNAGKCPIPKLADEPNASAVNVLLGSYVGTGAFDLTRYMELKRRESEIKKELSAEKQAIFNHCVQTGCIAVGDNNGNTGKWTSAGSFFVKKGDK